MADTRNDKIRQIRELLQKTVANGCEPGEAKGARDKVDAMMQLYNIQPAELGVAKNMSVVRWPRTNAQGRPLTASQNNVGVAIERLGLKVRYDTFLAQTTVTSKKWTRPLDDSMVRKLIVAWQKQLNFEPTTEAAWQGLLHAGEVNAFSSVQDYLLSLTWDGKRRVDTWLTEYLGVADNPLIRVQGELFLRAACKRAFDPGCKWDHIPVLEGEEDKGKSTTLRILANGTKPGGSDMTYFCDSPILHLEEKKQLELCAGVWFYELAEMAGLRKADGPTLKRFVTAQADAARKAYDRAKTVQPRTPTIAGTINPDPDSGEMFEYLLAGDRRRWWPWRVAVVRPIDLDLIHRDRDQLFAEVMQCYLSDASDFGSLALPQEFKSDAIEVARSREVVNPMVDKLANLYDDLTDPADTNVYKDGVVILSDGTRVEVGRDYKATETEIWVSANLVGRIVGNSDPSGRMRSSGMAGNAWHKQREAHTGRRGYAQKLEP
jgi:predicted P-loop ATPase